MERDDVIKAWECCGAGSMKCGECPYAGILSCSFKHREDALDLIRELTEENARLRSQANRLKQYDEERDIALHANLISNAKREVAREIFAEIETAFARVGILPHNVGLVDFNVVAELKKKYGIEGE